MIRFKTLKWKNLLSTGNNFQTIELDKNNKTMILGKNGHGKSTMIDAITFGLYGKPFRSIRKNNLINSVNKKDCVIEVHFTSGAQNYKIIRGIKPNIFEIYCNDELINQDAKIRDYQKYLERNILHMNYQTFTQVVVLGSSSYIPFMKLSTSHRRELVEELLDIKIFGSMNLLVKNEFRDITERYKEFSRGVDLLEEKIKMNKINLKSLILRNEGSLEKNENRLNENQRKIEDLTYNVRRLRTINDDLRNSIGDVLLAQKSNKKLSVLEGQLENKLRILRRSISFYNENESCPECEQDIDGDFKDLVLSDKDKLASDLEDGLQRLRGDLETSQKIIDNIIAIELDILNNESLIKSNETMIKSLSDVNEEIEKDITEDKNEEDLVTELREDIKKKENTLGVLITKLNDSIVEKEYLGIMKNILSDEGVKSSIIKKYIPLINKTINSYLSSMEFHARFELDEEFNETIYSRYVDQFSYANFSEGEKQRIDLALLFTWRLIASMKNSASTNLLIIDEIFDSSLDDNGTEEFMKILYTLENENVFVISHKNHMAERFDDIITFNKTGNFSRRI